MKVMKEAGKDDQQPGHFSAFVVGKITVEALKRAGRNVNRKRWSPRWRASASWTSATTPSPTGRTDSGRAQSPEPHRTQVVGKGRRFRLLTREQRKPATLALRPAPPVRGASLSNAPIQRVTFAILHLEVVQPV